MRNAARAGIAGLLTVMIFGAGQARAEDKPAGKLPEISFERHIRPILRANCLECHGDDTAKNDLDTRQARLLVRGGKSGPAVVPGKSAGSLLFRRVRKGEMPPDERKKLTPAQVALIGRWIDAGAPTDAPEKELTEQDETFVTAEDRKSWAFQSPKSSPIPTFVSTDRVRTPIDAFLLALLDRDQYFARFPEIDPDVTGDINGDEVLNAFDIQPFVELLFN